MMRNIPTNTVNSLGDLIASLARNPPGTGKTFWYRGHRSRGWSLLPSVWRVGDHVNERAMCHQFRARAALRMEKPPSYDDHAAWLSMMQHYGLPTRLLDWSTSPLVACYFVFEHLLDSASAQVEDAVIWQLDPHQLNLLEASKDYTPSIRSRGCADVVAAAFDAETVFQGEPSRADSRLRAVMADVSDVRIFVQQGAFTIHGRALALEGHPHAPKFLKAFEVPAGAMLTMARELKAAGYRRGDIYPDLANLAQEIRLAIPPH